MEQPLIHVLIADDEQIVRNGLKYIIDWEDNGFSICGEAANGEEALEKILKLRPELVLLDIRMPKLYGTELIEKLRREGYDGEIIILSGYSEFSYAQTAMHFGVSFYLTKPVDEDELCKALAEIKKKIGEKNRTLDSMDHYREKAKPSVLLDLLTGNDISPTQSYADLGLLAPMYQVVICDRFRKDSFDYEFTDLLKVSSKSPDVYDRIEIDRRDVYLLKGSSQIDRLQRILAHYEEGLQIGSPLDSFFLAYGPTVLHLSQIKDSCNIARELMSRRFFCDENQHVVTGEMLPAPKGTIDALTAEESEKISVRFAEDIQAFRRREIQQMLDDLRSELYGCEQEIPKIKYFLSDIFLQVKHLLLNRYPNLTFPFVQNAAILELIEEKQYLYEIIRYFSEQFELSMRAIGSNSGESVFDDIVYYIRHNYPQPLKLESLAPLFGYNSSYLGKLFTQKTGSNFNAYLDLLRLEEASSLLDSTAMKVYEISARVGYRNVDYFHQKFRKQFGMSPAEYRNRVK